MSLGKVSLRFVDGAVHCVYGLNKGCINELHLSAERQGELQSEAMEPYDNAIRQTAQPMCTVPMFVIAQPILIAQPMLTAPPMPTASPMPTIPSDSFADADLAIPADSRHKP
uniref:Uncharacterized protein n=1 Tax=Trichuris muris TaxID=70415 RepID=A0A5S6QPA2_TRIMR